MKNLIPNFTNYLKYDRGYSDNTIRAYKADINQLIESLPVTRANDLTPEHIRNWVKEQELAPASIQRKLSCIRTFLSFCYNEGFTTVNMTVYIPKPKRHNPLPEILSKDQVKRLLSLDGSLRDRLLIYLLYSCGLRRSEAGALDWEDVNYENKTLHIRDAKAYKDRYVPLIDSAIALLKEYQADKTSGPVFLNKNNKRLSDDYIYTIVVSFCKRLNVKGYPHILRHSYGTHLRSNGASLDTLQKLLGHADISSTMIYVKLDQETMVKEVIKAHPLQN